MDVVQILPTPEGDRGVGGQCARRWSDEASMSSAGCTTITWHKRGCAVGAVESWGRADADEMQPPAAPPPSSSSSTTVCDP